MPRLGAKNSQHDAGQGLCVRKGAPIYFENDTANHWYEIISGVVRTCRFQVDGHRHVTGLYYQGDVFGLETGRYLETAEAVTETVMIPHPHCTKELPAQEASRAYEWNRALRKALDCAQSCIRLLGCKTAEEKIAAFLIETKERLHANETITVPMSRGDIADHLGLTIHTVSRTITALHRRKLIALDGRQQIRILDEAGLSAIAGEVTGSRVSGPGKD